MSKTLKLQHYTISLPDDIYDRVKLFQKYWRLGDRYHKKSDHYYQLMRPVLQEILKNKELRQKHLAYLVKVEDSRITNIKNELIKKEGDTK